jgi:hypothetical protein
MSPCINRTLTYNKCTPHALLPPPAAIGRTPHRLQRGRHVDDNAVVGRPTLEIPARARLGLCARCGRRTATPHSIVKPANAVIGARFSAMQRSVKAPNDPHMDAISRIAPCSSPRAQIGVAEQARWMYITLIVRCAPEFRQQKERVASFGRSGVGRRSWPPFRLHVASRLQAMSADVTSRHLRRHLRPRLGRRSKSASRRQNVVSKA